MNLQIIQVFVKLREIVSLHKELAYKLEQLENKYEKHDKQIYAIFEQIREFLTFHEKPKKQIGFSPEKSLKHPQNKKRLKANNYKLQK